ncbi:mycothiol transferase [Actinomadura welshii]
MTSAQLLTDAFGRIREAVHDAAGGLTPRQLAFRPGGSANSIGWLVWHLTRVQDDHIADAAGTPQVWTRDGWAGRFALPLAASDTGYGHGSEEVAAVQVESAGLLTGYHDAVHDRTVEYVGSLADGDLDRVVDRAWDPPVTLAVRLVSVVADDLQHAGQAAFVRGLL